MKTICVPRQMYVFAEIHAALALTHSATPSDAANKTSDTVGEWALQVHSPFVCNIVPKWGIIFLLLIIYSDY